MNLSDTMTIPTQVMARQVGDETVILDLASGTYFGLDSMGTRIWQLIGQGQALAEICTILLTEYEVSAEELERDLLRLVHELDAQGLIRKA